MSQMSAFKKDTQLSGAILCSLGLMIFSYFIQTKFPVNLVSFGALITVAFVIAKHLKYLADLKKTTGEFSFSPKALLFISAGIGIGIGMAVLYRWHLNVPLFPGSLLPFALVAALIGSMEELVFRGFIQEQVRKVNGLFSILFSAFSHTGYKCCLFLAPVISSCMDIGFLASWTFVAGILIGTLRHFSKSIWPSLVAHALFDILVYGESVHPPWWVW
jgi:membrane protease YdiL (CAAX protease family)